jgi:hypothetical protein
LQQVKDKRYAGKYRTDGLPIYLIGVEFSRETRNVAGFEVESVVSAVILASGAMGAA